MVLTVNGRVGLVEEGSTFGKTRHLDDVGRVAAAGALGVEGMDGAALEGRDGVLDEARFVQRVGVDHDLNVVIVGDREAAIDRRRRRAPVLVELERAGAGLDHLDEGGRQRGVALAGKAEVHREGIEGAQHHLDVPRPGRAGRRLRPLGRAGAAAEHRRDARHQGVVDLLRADEMDVRIEAAGGQDLALAGDHLGARPDDDVDARLDIGVAGLADPLDAAALQPDVGLHDPPVIEDEGVGDDRIDGAVGVRRLRLPHAVADDLAAAELHLLAVDREVALDLDHEVRVGKAQLVADGRPEHVGIRGAGEAEGHGGEPQAVQGREARVAGGMLIEGHSVVRQPATGIDGRAIS